MKRIIHIEGELSIVVVRMQARDMAKKIGFNSEDQARVSIAASELARLNAWGSHRSGEITLAATNESDCQGLELACLVDLKYVPGGDQSSWANETSVSKRRLISACQLVDKTNIEAHDNKQARVVLVKWLKRSVV
jgi:hypothetical protein